MKVWLVKIGEPLPVEGNDVRLLRTGLFFEKLASRGHQALWWSSTFDHSKKQHLFNRNKEINLSINSRLRLIHSMGYRKNISFRRAFDHIETAYKFKCLSINEATPDVIFCSMPTLELSLAAVTYGKKNGVPVIVDLRDMWPDIFVSRAPKSSQWIVRKMFSHSFSQIKTICKNATGITGITPGYVDWGLRYAEREKTCFDRDFPVGYLTTPPELEKIREAESFWKGHGVHPDSKEFIVCLFSNIVKQLELDTVIHASRRLQKTGRRFRFVLCGRGDALEHFKKVAEDCFSVIFPGWVSKSQIWTLMKFAQVGVAPYRSTADFAISIPNKAIEYMSAGLPIVSSLKGTLQDLLTERTVGLTYENKNVDSLYRVLCELYDNPGKLKTMSINSRKLFNERFVGEKVYSNMCDYLEEVVTAYNIKDYRLQA